MDWTARAREIVRIETAAVQLRCTEKLLDYLTRDDEATLAYNALMENVRSQMAGAFAALAGEEWNLEERKRLFANGYNAGHAAGVAEERERWERTNEARVPHDTH